MSIRRTVFFTKAPTIRLDVPTFEKGSDDLWIFVNGIKAIKDVDYEEVSCSIIHFTKELPPQCSIEVIVIN